MIQSIQNPKSNVWYLAYNQNENIYHFGLVETNQSMITKQPVLEQFNNEDDLRVRVDGFKGDGWYDSQTNPNIDMDVL
jgi:hypothetical protein